MIIPVRCFTCGKVSIHQLLNTLGYGQQMEQVLGSHRQRRRLDSVSNC